MSTYKIYFAHTSFGRAGRHTIAQALHDAHAQSGPHLPAVDLGGGEAFQVRDLQRTGTVWTGVFAKLRHDAPHIINVSNEEREIAMDDGDRIVDKLHFLYRERPDVLVWQVVRQAGGLSRMQQYLSRVFDDYVALTQVMNHAELQRVLDGRLYELSFGYARPQQLAQGAPQWTQNTFDMMANVDAAQAKFMLRAPRGGSLAETAKRMVRQLVDGVGVEKVRVRLTDEHDPIELFMAPLRGSISVQLVGRYPVPAEVYQALEEAYAEHKDDIPARETNTA